MTDYTPTTDEVRHTFWCCAFDYDDSRRHEAGTAFDRWLAAHDAELLWAASQRIDANPHLIGVNRYGENETDVEYGPAIWKDDAVSSVMEPVWHPVAAINDGGEQ